MTTAEGSGRTSVRGPGPSILPASRQPPWLLVYIALAVVFVLPGQYASLMDEWGEIEAAQADRVPGVTLFRLLLVAHAVLPVSLVAGLVLAVVPRLRCWLVERHLPPIRVPDVAVQEMQRFVERHASGIEVCLTVKPCGLARIYPVSLRSSRIVADPAFLHLWALDRPAAEAILLHEVAHRRQGEHLLAGLGSPFAWLVRAWVLAFVVLSLIPVVALALEDTWRSALLTAAAAPQLVQDSVGPLKLLVFPVTALWTAELEADDWAAGVGGGGALRRAHEARRPNRWWRRGFALLDHPPVWLRRRGAGSRLPLLVLLAAWPAIPVGLHFALAATVLVPEYDLLWGTFDGLAAWFAEGFVLTLRSSVPVTVTAAATLLVWPWVATWWPRLWTAAGERASRQRARPHVVAAILPALLAVGAALPVPAAPAPATSGTAPQAVGVTTRFPDAMRPQHDPLVLRVSRVVRSQGIGTTPDASGTEAEMLARLTAMRWTFEGDGTFEAAAPDGPTVRGEWTASINRVVFRSEDLVTGSGASSGSMVGEIDATTKPLTLSVMWSVPASMALVNVTAEVGPG